LVVDTASLSFMTPMDILM